MSPRPGVEALERAIEEAFPRAQLHWSRWLLVGKPRADDAQQAIAQIDLRDRQISLNHRLILEKGLTGSIEAMLAHELGHHVRYPGTMAIDARLRLIEKSLIPFTSGYSVINLFTDLLINHHLGPALSDQLARVYRAFSSDGPALREGKFERDPAFLFYLSIYEELWSLPRGDLMGPARAQFEAGHPGYRAEAQVLSQNLFNLGPNLYAQFLYFLSILIRYAKPPGEHEPLHAVSTECRRGEPSPDDWADALKPNAAERAAIERGLREGWIDEREANILRAGGAARVMGLPGVGTKDAHLVPEIMAAYYRQEAERWLLRPPRQRVLGEAVVPTTLEPWEPGDSVRDIDWRATLNERGPVLGAAQPLLRAKVAEWEGHDVSFWQPRMEIWLDVSGSMPDPRFRENAMTLAAQVLCASTLRAGGLVRAVLYSGDTVEYWEWCRSEIEISRFLMHYIGGGTVFPFPLLARSVAECGREQPIRVVITDRDFDANFDQDDANRGILAEATAASPRFVLILHLPDEAHASTYRALGATVLGVEAFDDFPRTATRLAITLFPEAEQG